jgi:glucose-6-phosphate isomerase
MPSARTTLPAWQALLQHRRNIAAIHLRDLLTQDPARFEEFSLALGPMLLDYSKQLLTQETMRLLAALARECGVDSSVKRMFAGERINSTEKRAALHIALRAAHPVMLDGNDVTRDVMRARAAMSRLVHGVQSGEIRGARGRAFTDVVNIGIGGSDLGPRLVCEALGPYATKRLRPHFVSNVDGAAISSTLAALDPRATLVVIASKTFATQETLANARIARAWLADGVGGTKAIGKHLCAVTAATGRAVEFGVAPERVFPIWDWVGGRYSLWSAIGLPVAFAVGMRRFDELRAGGRAMDEHFVAAPLERNLPATLGLIEVWNSSFRGLATRAVVPYDERLRLLPAYLQQLEMESCGKHATPDGGFVDYATAPVTWGSAGTDGQHAYFQLLHQGTQVVPADFIACCRPRHRLRASHDLLLANFFAQTEALARGLGKEEAGAAMRAQRLPDTEIRKLLPHRVCEGDRPSTSILLDELTPQALGALIALYEHKVFVQSVIWNVNAFDQWGVELGKQLAERIVPELGKPGRVSTHDCSTNGLINHYKARRRPPNA